MIKIEISSFLDALFYALTALGSAELVRSLVNALASYRKCDHPKEKVRPLYRGLCLIGFECQCGQKVFPCKYRVFKSDE